MRLDMPGLFVEKMPSGNIRWRCRPKGDRTRKITLPCGPDHPAFLEHYHAARAGLSLDAPAPIEQPKVIRGSIAWLVGQYIDAMPGLGLDPKTIKQRTYFLRNLESDKGDHALDMPQSALVKIRDGMAQTPGAADNYIKTVRAMYSWAVARGYAKANPAAGLGKLIKVHEGATPWTVADLKQYRDRHAPGTMAHLALTLYMFTACRVSEIILLGPGNEKTVNGALWLDWQPSKAGASRVRIPVLPPLKRALEGRTVTGLTTYLVTEYGKPFASPAAFAGKFRKWCLAAGLADRSAHGIRKAAGELLAEAGATEYQIMSVHGHSSPATSKVYTQGAERARLASDAMSKLGNLDW